MLGTLSIYPPGKAAESSRRLRILIADDNRDAVATLSALLESEGHAVRGVHRSFDVLGVEREFRPHVVILDLQMPDISGFDLARWVRARHQDRCPLLIAVSGAYTRPDDVRLSRTAGFHYYLKKPFPIDDLLALTKWPVVRAARVWDTKKRFQ